MGRRALNAVGVAAALMHAPADSFLGPNARRSHVSNHGGSLWGSFRNPLSDGQVVFQDGSPSQAALRPGLSWRRTWGVRGGHGESFGREPGLKEDMKMDSKVWDFRSASHEASGTATLAAGLLAWNDSCIGEDMNNSSGMRGFGAVDVEKSLHDVGISQRRRAIGNGGGNIGGDAEASGVRSSSKLPVHTVLDAAQDVGNVPLEPRDVKRASAYPNLGAPDVDGDFDARLTEDRRGRAGFSLFRCDAYHCEREMVDTGEISASSPSTTQVMMRWNERPRRALVLLKPDQELLPLAAETIDFLQREMGLHVMVETAAADDVGKALDAFLDGMERAMPLEVFTPPERSAEAIMGPKGGAGPALPEEGGDGDSVDFVLTLGGDGLLMYSNTLFRTSVPPHLCFNLGSMGFLTPFEFETMKDEVRHIMGGGMKVSLRMRLTARIIREDQTSEAFHALNEIVIDRGSSPYLTNMECYCDDQHLTTVQADGLIIATPTGSTAYSMSAGGSMVHPCVPAILFTPICPHSLSFRPIVFPDTVVLRLTVPMEARADGRVSFDGKLSQPLLRGDTLVVKTSNFPVPTICKVDSTADWFASLDQALGFNTRMLQRGLNIQKQPMTGVCSPRAPALAASLECAIGERLPIFEAPPDST